MQATPSCCASRSASWRPRTQGPVVPDRCVPTMEARLLPGQVLDSVSERFVAGLIDQLSGR